MSEPKEYTTMSVRVPSDEHAQLEKVAEIDGISVAQAIRDAIRRHIDERRQDASFQSRLARSIERNNELLQQLRD